MKGDDNIISIEQLKQQITDDNIISLCNNMGAEARIINDKYIVFDSICHNHIDAHLHSPKLYYYRESKSYFCFNCSFHGDIIELIRKVKNISFNDAINYICQICNIDIDNTIQIDDWYSLKKYLPNYQEEIELKQYDDSALNLFQDYYHQSWLDDNITIDTMKKYNIKWYSRNNSIVIPCYDIDNNLVGIRQRYTLEEDCDRGKYQPLRLLDKNIQYNFPTGNILYGLNYNKDNISKYKKVIIYEGEKSVLKMDGLFDNNISVAIFGSNCTNNQKQQLLKLGINEVVIGLDFDYINPQDDKFAIYKAKVLKMANLFKPYCKVSVLYSPQEHILKGSPIDMGKSTFLTLYNQRMEL